MHDPLRAKAKVVLYSSVTFLAAIGLATGLGALVVLAACGKDEPAQPQTTAPAVTEETVTDEPAAVTETTVAEETETVVVEESAAEPEEGEQGPTGKERLVREVGGIEDLEALALPALLELLGHRGPGQGARLGDALTCLHRPGKDSPLPEGDFPRRSQGRRDAASWNSASAPTTRPAKR